MITTDQLRQKFINYYLARGHFALPSVSLLPQNDPTTLFTSSGMQSLVPYLLGQPHPAGRRLVNCQKSFRAQDIDEVGDTRHTTFFEMLGNWSLGDYFKIEQLPWVFRFLIEELGLQPDRIYVTVFQGQDGIARDREAVGLWRDLFAGVGLEASEGDRIVAYDARKNWWSRSGEPGLMPPGEPGGPDSEIFYKFPDVPHDEAWGESCHPNCDCGRFMEIGNSVFMQYKKQEDGSLAELAQRNVDFGGGLERMVAAANDLDDVFRIDAFSSLLTRLEELSRQAYGSRPEVTRPMRIVADHVRAAAMLMADGALPSNKAQGYVVRRLIRRAIRHGRFLSLPSGFMADLGGRVLDFYSTEYPLEPDRSSAVLTGLRAEEERFNGQLTRGLRELEKVGTLNGAEAFRLFETYGFPWEMTEEIAAERGQVLDRREFLGEFEKHRELSRSASQGMFRGGLADRSAEVVNLHTATHLLHQALRLVLGPHIQQKGSNITAERLRFDFSHPAKLTDDELQRVEALVNAQITADLPVSCASQPYRQALAAGALAFFGERYPDQVTVYSIGEFSREVCAGPHAERTGQLRHFSLFRQEPSGTGVRRVYGRCEKG